MPNFNAKRVKVDGVMALEPVAKLLVHKQRSARRSSREQYQARQSVCLVDIAVLVDIGMSYGLTKHRALLLLPLDEMISQISGSQRLVC